MAANRLGFKHKKVQRLRRLVRQQSFRESEGVFVAEGVKLFEEAASSGSDIESAYIALDSAISPTEIAERGRCRVHVLDEGVIERIAGTVNPQPIVTVVKTATKQLADLSADSVAVLVDVRDPGNAGTILRSAEASGIGAVVFCDGSVDPYNPKTVRSSAGAVFHVPVVTGVAVGDVIERMAELRVPTIGTAADATTSYSDADLSKPCAVLVGNEANGLSSEVQARLAHNVSIPIVGRSESLNAGVAFAVVAFEMARQRRAAR